MKEMVSIFLIHNSKLTTINWNKWIKLCFDFAENKKIKFSHIGIKSESLNPNKLRTFKRYEAKMLKCINSNEIIDYIELLYLPEEFVQAVFDFKVNMTLANDYVEVTMEKDMFDLIDYKKIIDKIGKIVNIINGEVNILPNDEVFNYNVNKILQRTSYDCDKRTNIMEI